LKLPRDAGVCVRNDNCDSSLATTAKVVALPRVGGIVHRYEWRAAA
jgi:hypothetical protein